jgi:hypothetical protein
MDQFHEVVRYPDELIVRRRERMCHAMWRSTAAAALYRPNGSAVEVF